MATLDTIPTRAGRAEVIRVLLTLAAGAGTNVADIRGSNANCTLTGDPVFDDALTLDGINPYQVASSQGDIRLRRTIGGFSTWAAANPTYELEFAASNDGDAVRTCTTGTVGGGFWNWSVTGIGSSIPDGGDTINLVITVAESAPVTDVDASFAAESGEPTATITPDTQAVTVTDVDASFAAESGEPTATITPTVVAVTDIDVSFAAESGEPTATITPTVERAAAGSDPVYTRLDSQADLRALFDPATFGSSQGGWIFDSGASTPTGSTGPGANNPDRYVFCEMSSLSSFAEARENSVITVKSTVMDEWLHEGRTLDFRAAIYGAFDATEGLDIEGSEDDGNTWERIELVHGHAYQANWAVGATYDDRGGTEREVVLAGGWVDYSVEIPERFNGVRMFCQVRNGNIYQHDIGLWQISFTDGDPPPVVEPTTALGWRGRPLRWRGRNLLWRS